MDRPDARRRIARGLLLALFLVGVAAAGAWAYRVYFSSTSYMLQRAEALKFRRMAVAQLPEEGNYRFWFVTNRSEQGGPGPLEERLGTVRATAPSYGSFDVSIEPTLGLGMLVNPTEWLQNREIQLNEARIMEQGQFVAGLREVVNRAPGRTLLIVVHGFREAFPSALRKTAFLGHVLDLDTPILVFDWPGNQGSTPGGFRRAREVARASATELAGLVDLINREIGPDRLSILANSMGGQVVVDAFRLLYQADRPAGARPPLDQVVLTAPDVNYREFNGQFRQVLEALARQTTIYVSSNDRALLASRLLTRSARLGESGLRPERGMPVVQRDPNADSVTVVDVTPVNRTRNFHNFSLETPEFFDDLYLRLANVRVPDSRLVYPVEGPNGSVYWVLTRGR